MNDNLSEEEEEALNAIYTYAFELKDQGLSNAKTRELLIEKGIDKEAAALIVKKVTEVRVANGATSNGAIVEPESDINYGPFLWIGGLLLFNLCSYLFDWPFWMY